MGGRKSEAGEGTSFRRHLGLMRCPYPFVRGGPDREAGTTVNVAAGEQVSLEYRTPLMLGLALFGKPALRVISHEPR